MVVIVQDVVTSEGQDHKSCPCNTALVRSNSSNLDDQSNVGRGMCNRTDLFTLKNVLHGGGAVFDWTYALLCIVIEARFRCKSGVTRSSKRSGHACSCEGATRGPTFKPSGPTLHAHRGMDVALSWPGRTSDSWIKFCGR